MGQRSRGKVRKALKSGVTVEPVTDREFMDLFFPMVEASYGRHQAVSPHPKQFFLSMYDRLMPQGLMGMFAAKYQGQVVAAALVPHDRLEARCMSIASIPEYHQHFPNNLLQWQIITWACAAGFERYDFGGKGDPGINRFKETFGPSPYAYAFYWHASPPVALARTLVLRAWPRVQWWRYQLRSAATTVTRRFQAGPSLVQEER
jgi:lipid II:glycine glycyltransferase (peptidoglycan interpeptide bridge formation enzyme)